MAEPRTDLAAEAHGINAERGIDDGIVVSESEICGVKITRAEVFAGEGEQKSGRRAGLYLTAEPGRVWLQSGEERRAAAEAVRRLLLSLLPAGDGAVLVAGLGNEAVTPDSVGPRTVGGLVVTHHMRALSAELYEALGFGDAAAVCPGVLGQTGIESAELIKAAVGSVRPRCVIAVDALAARSLDRLGTTIQLTNAGIAPGSGVCNGRAELSERTLGCPVIGVGVPTVVDAQTLVCELVGGRTGQGSRGSEAAQDGCGGVTVQGSRNGETVQTSRDGETVQTSRDGKAEQNDCGGEKQSSRGSETVQNGCGSGAKRDARGSEAAQASRGGGAGQGSRGSETVQNGCGSGAKRDARGGGAGPTSRGSETVQNGCGSGAKCDASGSEAAQASRGGGAGQRSRDGEAGQDDCGGKVGQRSRGSGAAQDGRYKNFFVTPKETDVMIRVMSKLLATAINLALHPHAPDINDYAPL